MVGKITPVYIPKPVGCLGWDGTDFYALTVDVAGHLQIDVVNITGTIALPTLAATSTNQATEITALQLIDNLYNALHSVNTDELVVRGENQLFSYAGDVCNKSSGAVSGANGYRLSSSVPANTVWVITQMSAFDLTTATTRHTYRIIHSGDYYDIYEPRAAFVATQQTNISCNLYLATGDYILVYFWGSLVGDICVLILHGYSMTKE